MWGGPETLIVVSSDLSHYHGYETARRLDSRTAAAIERGDLGSFGPNEACGYLVVAATLTRWKGASRPRCPLGTLSTLRMMFSRYQIDGAVATAHDIAHLTMLLGRAPRSYCGFEGYRQRVGEGLSAVTSASRCLVSTF